MLAKDINQWKYILLPVVLINAKRSLPNIRDGSPDFIIKLVFLKRGDQRVIPTIKNYEKIQR